MTLNSDLVLTETMVVSENTVITGNGFKIICQACDPVIRVEDDAELTLNNVRFPKVYTKWISVQGPGSRATWSGGTSNGYIVWNGQ